MSVVVLVLGSSITRQILVVLNLVKLCIIKFVLVRCFNLLHICILELLLKSALRYLLLVVSGFVLRRVAQSALDVWHFSFSLQFIIKSFLAQDRLHLLESLKLFVFNLSRSDDSILLLIESLIFFSAVLSNLFLFDGLSFHLIDKTNQGS